MTPTHANKRGARYRYYVSHPLLQKRSTEAGSVARVPAPEVENIALTALREHIEQAGHGGEDAQPTNDRDLIERHVARIVVRSQAIEIHLRDGNDNRDQSQSQSHAPSPNTSRGSPTVIPVPWSATRTELAKGILHSSSAKPKMSAETRDALLSAIAKARGWIDDLMEGRVVSFAEIAEREGKVERHLRILAPLAFVSPRIVSAIIDGSAPANLTVTELTKSLPYSWAEQERRLQLPHP